MQTHSTLYSRYTYTVCAQKTIAFIFFSGKMSLVVIKSKTITKIVKLLTLLSRQRRMVQVYCFAFYFLTPSHVSKCSTSTKSHLSQQTARENIRPQKHNQIARFHNITFYKQWIYVNIVSCIIHKLKKHCNVPFLPL